MGGFTAKEKCAFPSCERSAPIIHDTALDPRLILVFCKQHIPRDKNIKIVTVTKGKLKNKTFGICVLYNEENLAWIKKCKACVEADFNIDPNHVKERLR